MRRSIGHDMVRFEYVATRAQLRELGYTSRDIAEAVEAREVWPIGRRWLVHQGATPQAVRAVALGGRLTAGSALASYGLWVTHPPGLQVRVPQTASHVPVLLPGERRFWATEHFPQRGDQLWRMSVQDSLLQYTRVCSETDAVASFDSALNRRLVTSGGIDDVFAVLPRRYRRLRARIDGRAESGLETLLRLAAEAEGWRVDIQVRIPGVGRVDVLIDGWLVIELDGARWHDGDPSQEEDRRRDAELTLRGYRWHRFRSSQVLAQMPVCIEVIRTILADGRPASR